jgi:transposase
MRKLAIGAAAVMQVAIRQAINRSEESRYHHRLHGLLLVASGRSCTEVGQLFGQEATTVQRWVHRFEQSGFAGLREGDRPGRPTSLDKRQWTRLARDLRRDPRRLGHAQPLWDGPLLAAHLRRHYGVSLGVRQCQRIFTQLGFRLRKPRPHVAQSDPGAGAAFKKPAPAGTAQGR